jgi:hypothetical protein
LSHGIVRNATWLQEFEAGLTKSWRRQAKSVAVVTCAFVSKEGAMPAGADPQKALPGVGAGWDGLIKSRFRSGKLAVIVASVFVSKKGGTVPIAEA